MNEMNATYSPEDNKLRLYSYARLDAATFERVKAAGFKWAPKQGFFVAPMWTPAREDLLIELCGEIGDEDSTLSERAEFMSLGTWEDLPLGSFSSAGTNVNTALLVVDMP